MTTTKTNIDFDHARWERIKADAAAWWRGDLARPLIQARLRGADPGRPEPDLPAQEFTSFYDLQVPAEAIVDRWDYDLSGTLFLGDAFPHVRPNFGPGVLAAFLGSRLENGTDTVWFHPRENRDPQSLTLCVDTENRWYRRILSLCAAAIQRWQGRVQIGMTDLGGNMDILAGLRDSQSLMMDLFDCPDQIDRLNREAHACWWQCFDTVNTILQPVNPGYTSWAEIYSETPHYMLQCDFCYMLGPDMFRRFVQPELQQSAARLRNAFYHLDGPGQLNHLDALLGLDCIRGIQWIPGAGQPEIDQWPDVYRKIRDAGKLVQIYDSQYRGGHEILDILADQLGSAQGIVYMIDDDVTQRDAVERVLEDYGYH
jgi:hypothetical protein